MSSTAQLHLAKVPVMLICYIPWSLNCLQHFHYPKVLHMFLKALRIILSYPFQGMGSLLLFWREGSQKASKVLLFNPFPGKEKDMVQQFCWTTWWDFTHLTSPVLPLFPPHTNQLLRLVTWGINTPLRQSGRSSAGAWLPVSHLHFISSYPCSSHRSHPGAPSTHTETELAVRIK